MSSEDKNLLHIFYLMYDHFFLSAIPCMTIFSSPLSHAWQFFPLRYPMHDNFFLSAIPCMAISPLLVHAREFIQISSFQCKFCFSWKCCFFNTSQNVSFIHFSVVRGTALLDTTLRNCYSSEFWRFPMKPFSEAKLSNCSLNTHISTQSPLNVT